MVGTGRLIGGATVFDVREFCAIHDDRLKPQSRRSAAAEVASW